MGPFRELDFGYGFRTHELDFLQSANLAVKRILFRLDRLQAIVDFFERVLIESRANLADANQVFFLVVKAEDKRAKVFAATFGVGIASDDAFLALRDFYFQPIICAL